MTNHKYIFTIDNTLSLSTPYGKILTHTQSINGAIEFLKEKYKTTNVYYMAGNEIQVITPIEDPEYET